MKNLWRNSILLFCAFRASDLINLVGGLYFVPRFVSPAELGAILPVTSFATFLAIPLFAFAMTMMKEASVLVAESRQGELKSLLRGTFAVGGIAILLALFAAAALVPAFLNEMRVNDVAAGYLVIAAAFLGCLAPIYTDQLQAAKRFITLGLSEIIAAATRLGVMFVVMPFRALAGYFAGAAALPAVRIVISLLALHDKLSVPAAPFWTRQTVRRIILAFIAILAYQAAPMGANLVEMSVLRTSLPGVDSAGYYMATRLSDLLNYLTFPVLLVMFPYTASAASRGESTTGVVRKCVLVTLSAATVWSVALALFGSGLMTLLPHGEEYLAYVPLLPAFVLICALNAAQVFYTNTEVSAGRFGFLVWFLPLNLVYAFLLNFFAPCIDSLDALLLIFAGISFLRFSFANCALIHHASA